MSKVMFPNLQKTIFKFVDGLREEHDIPPFTISFFNNISKEMIFEKEKSILWIHGRTACVRTESELLKMVASKLTSLTFEENINNIIH